MHRHLTICFKFHPGKGTIQQECESNLCPNAYTGTQVLHINSRQLCLTNTYLLRIKRFHWRESFHVRFHIQLNTHTQKKYIYIYKQNKKQQQCKEQFFLLKIMCQ